MLYGRDYVNHESQFIKCDSDKNSSFSRRRESSIFIPKLSGLDPPVKPEDDKPCFYKRYFVIFHSSRRIFTVWYTKWLDQCRISYL